MWVYMSSGCHYAYWPIALLSIFVVSFYFSITAFNSRFYYCYFVVNEFKLKNNEFLRESGDNKKKKIREILTLIEKFRVGFNSF